ncbi:MAG: DUF1573 domain-containing protein [Ignavibacteria bacterium]
MLLLSILLYSNISFSQGSPRFVSIDGESINTGSHIKDKVVSYELNFKNDGDADLKIESISVSCGCTSALSSSDIIKPGEIGTINFNYNGQGFGEVSKSIYVQTNEKDKNVHNITFIMNMLNPLTINPSSIITQAKVGDELNQVATLQNTMDKVISITEISSNSPVVKITSDKTLLQNGEAASINISIKIYEDAPVNAAVLIKTTEGDFQIPIFVDIKN